MQWTIEEIGTAESSVGPVELRMSVGVHSGDCHFFLTELPHRELVVCGPGATRVFELEDLASAGEIVVSGETAAPRRPGLARRRARRRPPDAPARARRERRAAAADVAGRDLDLYVPAPLARSSRGRERRGRAPHVTVAFVKLSGTDDLIAAAGPEALLEPLDALAAVVGRACAAYGITWLESDIDVGAVKLYLTAGAPSSTGDDAEGMVRGLREILAGRHRPAAAGRRQPRRSLHRRHRRPRRGGPTR